MRPGIRIAGAALAILIVGGAAQARTQCSPRIVGATILRSPDVNDIHPDWRPESGSIGTGWGLRRVTRSGQFLRGGLVTSRGNPMSGTVWVLAREWECSPPVR